LRHGLTARTAVLPTEIAEAFQRHIQQFLEEYKPATPTETQLVYEIANAARHLNRIPFLEAELLSRAANLPNEQAAIQHDPHRIGCHKPTSQDLTRRSKAWVGCLSPIAIAESDAGLGVRQVETSVFLASSAPQASWPAPVRIDAAITERPVESGTRTSSIRGSERRFSGLSLSRDAAATRDINIPSEPRWMVFLAEIDATRIGQARIFLTSSRNSRLRFPERSWSPWWMRWLF
jgi:hypothetical protein